MKFKFLIPAFAFLASIPAVMAHCPLCTAATGAAVGVARFYGVDDAIMGVLIGGFVVSSALWFNNVCKRRNRIFFYGQGAAVVLVSLILTIVGFKAGNLLTGALLFGLPRLLTGMLFGTGATWAGHGVHEYLRSRNNGKNLISLQGMSVMLAAMLLVSAVFAGGVL